MELNFEPVYKSPKSPGMTSNPNSSISLLIPDSRIIPNSNKNISISVPISKTIPLIDSKSTPIPKSVPNPIPNFSSSSIPKNIPKDENNSNSIPKNIPKDENTTKFVSNPENSSNSVPNPIINPGSKNNSQSSDDNSKIIQTEILSELKSLKSDFKTLLQFQVNLISEIKKINEDITELKKELKSNDDKYTQTNSEIKEQFSVLSESNSKMESRIKKDFKDKMDSLTRFEIQNREQILKRIDKNNKGGITDSVNKVVKNFAETFVDIYNQEEKTNGSVFPSSPPETEAEKINFYKKSFEFGQTIGEVMTINNDSLNHFKLMISGQLTDQLIDQITDQTIQLPPSQPDVIIQQILPVSPESDSTEELILEPGTILDENPESKKPGTETPQLSQQTSVEITYLETHPTSEIKNSENELKVELQQVEQKLSSPEIAPKHNSDDSSNFDSFF